MKPTARRLLLLAASLPPALADAHPGHDGDHDFVWDFDHLAAHPVATALCAIVLTVGVWNAGLFLKSRRAKLSERSFGQER